MLKRIATAVLLALGFAGSMALAGHAQAQQFSAKIISGNAASAAVGGPGRLYVANHKVRIETPNFQAAF